VPVVTADGYDEVKLSVASSRDSSANAQVAQQGQAFDELGLTELSLTLDEVSYVAEIIRNSQAIIDFAESK